MADISIPEGDNPVRYQASLGGNQKYRNMGNVSGQAYLVRGQVTNVYYQKGTLDFNTYGSSVTSGVTDGSGSAPIPVDFWGKNTDGKVFGCYRPVQKGSQILVAYIGGDTSRPIVIGVYPDNEASYELISPVHYNTGDDSTDDVQNDALGERKIYPNQQMMYESGKGDILRSMGGKSFLYISENGSGYLDDINYAYDEISDFYDADANEIEPTMTKAQSWLLVHEDNESDEASDGHRTRFYVNRSGELMVTFANKADPNNIVVLEASKDSGFKLTKRFDNSNIKEDSEDYVQFGIGDGNNVSIKSVDSGDATSFYLDNGNIKFSTPKKGSITFDGISVNDLLGKVSDAETAANDAGTKADIAASAGAIAQSAASDAASQALAASQAGEDAKSAAVNAQAAGEDAKTQAEDTRNRIIYYSSISNEKDVAIPGKYIIVNTDTYIKNGTIKTAHIGDGAITNAKIANLAVGTAQLEDAAITRGKIGNLAVGTAQIEDAAITDAKVGDLRADHLKAGTIDFSVISGIHINASEIDVGKIVADQIFVNGLGDISKNLGTVTSGKITGTNVNDDINTVQSGVNDLNNPNLMSVIEKQTAAKQFAGLTSQYNVILARAKDDNISTTDLTTAYTNLDTFITPLLKDTTKASNIDRYTYNSLTYAYNTALSNVQTALKDSFNADIDNMHSSVLVASQAASSAAIVASQAAITGNNANQVASRAIVAANDAQSAGNNAISVANNASQAASGAVIAGSQAASNADKAITAASQAKIAGNNATSIANNASQAASGAIIAGSAAAVIANKASTVANEAKSAGDNATSVANNATSVANSARSVADNTYAYANSEISIQSTATAKAQSAADNAFSKAQAVGSQASAEIAVQSTATAKAQSTADNAFSQAQAVGSRADSEIAVNSMATAKAQSTADNAFSQAQAVGSQASADISNNSTATAKAQSTADNAFSQAQAVGSQASAEINSNSTATAKAQSTADNAFSQATTAIDNGKVTSQAVTDLKDGSKLTIAELENGLATKVANSDYASYKEQTASQIGQLVTNGAFSAYQTQTADLIAQKVATSDFSAYQATTAKAIESKVESKDFNTYKTQTADLIDDKVSSSQYSSDKTQTASEIADRVSNSAFSTYQTQTASQIASKVDNGDFSTYKTQTANLIGSKVDNGVYQSDKTQTANSISSKVSSSDFNTYKTQTADLIDDKVSNSAYASDKTQTASEIADRVSNSAFSTYQTQTASQIASKVDNGDFSTYKTQTADLIASKVANKDFSAYQATTAKAIESKVESKDFNTYKSQTADLIDDKVSNSAYASDKTQTASEIADRVSNSAFSTYQTQTASQIASKVDNGDFSTYKTQTADLIASKVATKDFSAYQATTAKSIDSKVESSDFNTYKKQTADMIYSKVSSVDFNNLKISNRNLALVTATPFKKTGSGTIHMYSLSKTIAKGTTVTIAYDITSTNATGVYTIQFIGGSYQGSPVLPLTAGTQHQSFTLVTDTDYSDVQMVISSSTATVTVSNFIISESSKEVSWTPAPEDQATQSQITQLSGEIEQKVSNSEYASYKDQTASQIGQMVTNGAFSAYQQTTADLISSKVATKDFSAYQATTAKSIDSKVESSDFNTYKSQTADLIDAKVSSSEYASDKTQTASEIADRVSNSAFSTYQTQTASQIASKVDNGDFSTYKTQTADLIAQKVATKDFSAYQATTAKSIDSKVESNDFNTYKSQTDKAILSKVESSDFQALQMQVDNSAVGTNLLKNTGELSSTSTTSNWNTLFASSQIYDSGIKSLSGVSAMTFSFDVYVPLNTNGGDVVGIQLKGQNSQATNTGSNEWDTLIGEYRYAIKQDDLGKTIRKSLSIQKDYNYQSFDTALADTASIVIRQSSNIPGFVYSRIKLEKGNLATDWCPNPEEQATQSQITQLSGEIDLRVTKGDLVDQINIQAGKTLISSSGQLILSGKSVVLDSVDPVIMKSANIGNMAVGTAQIANGAITNAQIGSLAVDTANIKDAAINSAKIANLAVGTAQIGDGAITNAKIGKLAVGTAQIANGAITDAQIGSLAVGTAQIKDEAVNSAKIAKLAVGTAQIGDGAITNAKIGKLAVGTAQIANAAITDAQIGDVSANKLTAGTIDFNTITGKNINASNIATGKLSTERLNVDKLSAVSANLGDITTGSLKGVNIVAKTFSTPNGSFTTDENGVITAKKMTLSDGTVSSTTINASTINGTTINAGTISNNANNTAKFYPFTADSDGVLRSYHVDDYFANYARMYSGNIVISDRNMVTTDGNKYGGETAVIGGSSISLSSGYTVGKDTDFSKPLVADGDGTTQLILSGVTGISLNGSNQSVTFKGTSSTGTNGIRMDSYGNLHGEGTSSWWRVQDSAGHQVANFGTAPGNNITFPKPIFTDEIGALRSSNDGRILIHDLKGDAQMGFSNDGNPRVASATIYNRTYSSGSTVTVTSYGTLGRITSASKYKLDITKETSLSPANNLLSIDRSSWVDKESAERLADSKTNGTDLSEPEMNVFRHYGLIAEDLTKAGLDEFVIKGNDGQAEGIEYDRLWTVLIPKIRDLSNQQIDDRLTISRLENEVENLKQEVLSK